MLRITTTFNIMSLTLIMFSRYIDNYLPYKFFFITEYAMTI